MSVALYQADRVTPRTNFETATRTPRSPARNRPALDVDRRVDLRHVQPPLEQRRVVVLAAEEPERVVGRPLPDDASRRPREDPAVPQRKRGLGVDAAEHRLQHPRLRAEVDRLPRREDLVEEQAAEGGLLLLVLRHVAADGDGERRVRGGDVVHGVPLDAEERGPAAPRERAERAGQPDAVLEEAGRVVEERLERRLEAVVEPAAVRRRADRRVEVRGAETGGGADPVGEEEAAARPGERGGRYGRLGHRDPVLLQLHPDVLHVRRDERGDRGEEHLDGAGREEVPVVLRVDPQGEPVARNGDVAEADVREGEGDPVLERGAGRFDGLQVRRVVDRDQRAADVEGDGGGDADLASPLPARVDFQPLERLDAGAEIERGADGGREIFRLRRVGRLAFVADRAVLREQREPRRRGVLDAAEREGLARPLARVGEQLDLEPFPLRGERLLAEAAVAEAERDVESGEGSACSRRSPGRRRGASRAGRRSRRRRRGGTSPP